MSDHSTILSKSPKVIGVAADHGGFELKQQLVRLLREAGHHVDDFGARSLQPTDDYPDFVIPLARAVADGRMDRGVAICGSGVGACVAANQVAGVRACLIHETFSAHQGVEDDNLNLICLGGQIVGAAAAWELVETFLAARFSGEDRHRRRLAKVAMVEASLAQGPRREDLSAGGKPVPLDRLVNVPRLITAYYSDQPDPSIPAQRVAFGTSGHRGSSFAQAFNENHILAITQAICVYRSARKITGPLFIGIDTHALSASAFVTALEVLAANGVEVMIAPAGDYTPSPVISHAIIAHNRGRTSGLADGIVITPSHNPPQDGGFKYNLPHGGPADTRTTAWIEGKANALLEAGLDGVKRVTHEQALRAATTHRHDYLEAYVDDLCNVVDLPVIRDCRIHLGVDPLGGAGVRYWPRIAEQYGLDLTVVNPAVDPTFRFMTADWDGQIRMDPSSPYAMAGLVEMKDRFDLSFACDTDNDRHGIVTKAGGLLPPNHALCSAISYLFQHRPKWPAAMAVGKTVVSSALIDRVAARLGRKVYEVPVGFKWFVDGLQNGSLAFAGEESAGATFARLDGSVWTTDKDGFVPCLLAAEMTARTGRDPGESYRALIHELGEPFYERVEAPATPREKAALAALAPGQVAATECGGEKIRAILTQAPGSGAPIGGVKVEMAHGWFAARPSGTEDIYKIYVESFLGAPHLQRILDEAQHLVAAALRSAGPALSPPPHQQTEQEAIEAWENEGDPN